MNNEQLITTFYTSFSKGKVEQMLACYDEDVIFTDPAFGELKGKRAHYMWRMLLSKNTSALSISFGGIKANEHSGSAHWIAKYTYGPKKRKITNKITANFMFKEGKIIRHTDAFDLWRWSSQALGFPGLLLGWTPFMNKQIRKMANQKLDAFISKSGSQPTKDLAKN